MVSSQAGRRVYLCHRLPGQEFKGFREKVFEKQAASDAYVAFDTPIGLMRKIQKKGFLVLES